jgi:hypothetical protein
LIPKPIKCGENWLDMRPTQDGRICAKCNKKIYDFRKKSWNEIENLHLNSSQPVCGTYSEKQLDNWGTKIERSNWSSIKYMLTLVGMLESRISNSQDNSITEKNGLKITQGIVQYQNKNIKDQLTDTVKSKFLKGKVSSKDGTVLPGVNVTIKNTSIGTVTDADGEFSMSFEDIPERTNQTLVFSFIGLKTSEIPFRVEYWTHSTINIKMEEDLSQLSEFYVTRPSFWQRIKNSFRRTFASNN